MLEPDPPILSDPRDLTPEWLSAVLQRSGHDVRVRALRSEAVGTGQMAHNERIFLEYEGPASGAPSTLVGKFPSPDESSRASGASGGYRCEVFFYTELAADLAIRTPACFYAAISDDSTSCT